MIVRRGERLSGNNHSFLANQGLSFSMLLLKFEMRFQMGRDDLDFGCQDLRAHLSALIVLDNHCQTLSQLNPSGYG